MTTNTTTTADGLAAPGEPTISGLLLEGGNEYQPALVLGSSLPATRNGLKLSHFWKESLRPGSFSDSRGTKWTITPDDIDAAVSDLHKSMSLGHEPTIQDDHVKPTRSFGFVTDARKNARGGLELLHSFMGDDARDEALRRKTSVMLIPNFKDTSTGQQYRWFTDHSAVVFRPQLKHLNDYQPALAASGEPVNAVSMTLAADIGAPPQKEPPMEQIDLSKLRARLGEKAKDKPDSELPTLMLSALDEAEAKVKAPLDVSGLRSKFDQKEVAGKSDAEVLALAADTIPALIGQLTEAERARDSALALSATEEPEMDARLRAMLGDAAEQQRELALSSGITPAQAKAFDELFDDASGNPNTLALSAAGPGNKTFEFEFWKRVRNLADGLIQVQNSVKRGVPVQPNPALTLSADDENKKPEDVTPEELKKLRADWDIPAKKTA